MRILIDLKEDGSCDVNGIYYEHYEIDQTCGFDKIFASFIPIDIVENGKKSFTFNAFNNRKRQLGFGDEEV